MEAIEARRLRREHRALELLLRHDAIAAALLGLIEHAVAAVDQPERGLQVVVARVLARRDARVVSDSLTLTSDTVDLRLGAGLEQKLGTNTFVKAEYRYSNYKEIEDFDIDADRHQVVAGVGIRF